MKNRMKKVLCMLAVMAVAVGIMAPCVKAAGVKYKTYSNKRFVYTVKYPTVFNKKADYGSNDGTKLTASDGKATATIWNSYGKNNTSGKSIVATAKKSKKIKVIKQSKKEAHYSYTSGKNIVHNYTYLLPNGRICFQMTYPKSKKAYFEAASKGMVSSIKKNKTLTLKD